MRRKQEIMKCGLILALGFLVGVIGVSAPTSASAGCSVVGTGYGTGEVVTCSDGQGLIVEIEGNNVKLVGLGPVWFWEAVGYERPQIGDEVTVWWNIVECNEVKQKVLTALDYDENAAPAPLELRNDLNMPLWNVAKRQITRQQQLAHQHRKGMAK